MVMSGGHVSPMGLALAQRSPVEGRAITPGFQLSEEVGFFLRRFNKEASPFLRKLTFHSVQDLRKLVRADLSATFGPDEMF